jgi:branched-chain amino acid transport system permease protein
VEVLVLQLAGGLLKATFLFLLAVGLSLIFGVTRVINLAHGVFYMLGAYLAYTVSSGLEGSPFAFWVALVVAPLLVAALGGLIEIVLLRRVYGAGELYVALLTFSLILIGDELVRIIWGPNQLNVSRPPGFGGAIAIGSRFLPTYNLLLLAIAVAIGVLLWVLVFRTRFGLLVRAAALDREMLACLGVSVPRLFTLTFVLGTWLAGMAGALVASLIVLDPSMDVNIIIETFSVVVIGGLGSLTGSVVSAVLLGQLESFGILVWSDIALPLVFLLMAVVLIARPWGLFGRPEQS